MTNKKTVNFADVPIPYDVAVIICDAFLPSNPSRMKKADPRIVEAAIAFKLALENHILAESTATAKVESEEPDAFLSSKDEAVGFAQYARDQGYAGADAMHPSAWAAWKHRAGLASKSIVDPSEVCPGPQEAWYLSVSYNGEHSHGFLTLDRPFGDRIRDLSRGGYSCTVTQYAPVRVVRELSEIAPAPPALHRSRSFFNSM